MKLDIAVNEYDYSGNIDFEFTQELFLHRVFPMAGPLNSSILDTKLVGTGFRPGPTV